MEMMNPTKRSNSNYTSRAYGGRPIGNLIPATANNTVHGGLFYAPPPPPPLNFSYPPYNYKNTIHSVFNPQVAAVPPLLPLPTYTKPNNTLPSRIKSFNSSPSPTRKQKPLMPKKSPKKPQTRKDYSDPMTKQNKQFLVTTVPLAGPDPNDLPKGGDKVLRKTTPLPFTGNSNVRENGFERFSGSVAFPLLSPPPSSLPLPRFSVRPKRISSCTTEAAAAGGGGNIIVDAGAATDNLCRLLRLR